MKIQLPSADHRLLLYDRGGKAVEASPHDFFYNPDYSFPCANDGTVVSLFELIGRVHGPEAQKKAISQPMVLALNVWPGAPIATAFLRRRWGIPEIAWVTVLEDARGYGLGAAMVRDLLQRCNTRYVCAVTSNPSVVPFWEKCGFHVAEEIPEDK